MDRELSHEELRELTGAYALDAVEPDERELVELHLMECPRCRAEVAEFREVAAFLAHNGYIAPEGLWDRISGALEETPPPLDLAPVVPLPARRSTGMRIAAAVAAAAAVMAVFFGVKVVDQGNQLDRIEAQNAIDRAVVQAQQDPRSRTVDLVSANGAEAAGDRAPARRHRLPGEGPAGAPVARPHLPALDARRRQGDLRGRARTRPGDRGVQGGR